MNDTEPIQICLHAPAMLTGPMLGFRPLWALRFNSLADGVVFSQLFYRADGFDKKKKGSAPIRISYSKMQKRDFPFYTRRYLIEVIQRLELAGAIKVNRNGGVNIIEEVGNMPMLIDITEQNRAMMLIFPQLACKVGLLEAIALQQIHLRHHVYDGSTWAIKSLAEWHQHCFMYLGIATVKRLFARMRDRDLIYVKEYAGRTGPVNSYRVNYVKLASVLELPVPDEGKPTPANQKDWIGPITLAKYKNPTPAILYQ